MNGHIIYSFDIKPYIYLTLPPLTYSPAKYPNGVVVKVTTPDDHHVEVKVEFANIASKDDASVIGMDLASTVGDRLVFEYGLKLDGPRETSRHFVGGADLNIAGAALAFFMPASQTIKVPPQDEPTIRGRLVPDEPNRGTYKATLRFVLQCDDPVARYLLLYAMLYELRGQSQSKVDTWLNGTFGVALPHSNPLTNKPMSDITKLRNDIAHPPAGVSLANTRQQMEVLD